MKRVLHLNEDNTITLKADNSEHVKTVIISEDEYQGNVVKSYPFFYFGQELPFYQLQIMFLLITFLMGLIVYLVLIITNLVLLEKKSSKI